MRRPVESDSQVASVSFDTLGGAETFAIVGVAHAGVAITLAGWNRTGSRDKWKAHTLGIKTIFDSNSVFDCELTEFRHFDTEMLVCYENKKTWFTDRLIS